MNWHQDIDTILYTKEDLAKRVKELADIISTDYHGREILILCILKGASLFCADLMRELSITCSVEYMRISSYGNATVSSGNVSISYGQEMALEGKELIIVEDIIDSGNTMTRLLPIIKEKKPASVKVCTLLDKKSARKVPYTPDYIGFEIGNQFIVGYGLDYAERYRQLPYIGILKQEVYQ